MLDLHAILDIVTTVLLAIAGYGLFLLRAGTEAAVKTSAEEAARATIEQLKWPSVLARELQKTRGVERQELRFKGYGALWKELRPLAIYDAAVINKEATGKLSTKLSDWYFSENGGLLLTPQARHFYFALQDLLQTTSRFPQDWSADRSEDYEGAHRNIFHKDVLTARWADPAVNGAISAYDYFSAGAFEDWQDKAADFGKKWREGIDRIAAGWNELDERQRFATLQQVGSILRTCLVNDLESRLG
jgi:hypothetical protein